MYMVRCTNIFLVTHNCDGRSYTRRLGALFFNAAILVDLVPCSLILHWSHCILCNIKFARFSTNCDSYIIPRIHYYNNSQNAFGNVFSVLVTL